MSTVFPPRAGTNKDLVRAKLAAEAVSSHRHRPAPLKYAPDTGFTVATLTGVAAISATMLGFAIVLAG